MPKLWRNWPNWRNRNSNAVRTVPNPLCIFIVLTLNWHFSTFIFVSYSFRKNAQRLSNILRDDPVAPADKAAHWITHVTKFGGDYLRPKILDMNFLQSSMIDVYGFMLCLSLAFMLMARKLCLWSCRYLYRRLHGVAEIQKMKQKWIVVTVNTETHMVNLNAWMKTMVMLQSCVLMEW